MIIITGSIECSQIVTGSQFTHKNIDIYSIIQDIFFQRRLINSRKTMEMQQGIEN